MDKFLFLSLLLSISAFTKGDNDNSTEIIETGDSVLHTAVSFSVGSLILIGLFVWLICYYCNRNQAPEGFTQFNNENERNPPTGRPRRWRNRRFFRRNRHPNPPHAEARQSTHITIQPVLAFGIPSEDESSGAPAGAGRTVPSASMAPPAYDESLNNQSIPSQFMNPQMPNQFVNPPMPSQYMNPPMPNNFNNPVPGNFNNVPMGGNFNNQHMPRHFESSKKSNAPFYNTKY